MLGVLLLGIVEVVVVHLMVSNGVLGQMNVQITCTHPVVVEDISLGFHEVTRLDIYCDQPDILLAARP